MMNLRHYAEMLSNWEASPKRSSTVSFEILASQAESVYEAFKELYNVNIYETPTGHTVAMFIPKSATNDLPMVKAEHNLENLIKHYGDVEPTDDEFDFLPDIQALDNEYLLNPDNEPPTD